MPSLHTSDSLARRRRKALWTVVRAAGTTGAASTAPTTGLEIPKQAAVGLTDLVMLGTLYSVYFDEQPDQAQMTEMLTEAGVVLAAAGGLAYTSVKFTEATLAEILNFVPLVGWLASGAITASVTTTVGLLWLWGCDSAYRRGTSPMWEVRTALG